MSLYVVMLGPPGAGKGTQARQIAAKHGIPHISTGDMFRAIQHEDSDLARRVRMIMARGELVPDSLTVEMVRDRLQQPDAANGAILDGFPRTVEQAEALAELLDEQFDAEVNVAFLFSVPKKTLFERIRRRADEEERLDDVESALQRRYEVYNQQTAPLVDYYRQRGRLIEVDGDRPIEAITSDLLNHLAACKQAD